jgi:hypothetical protein
MKTYFRGAKDSHVGVGGAEDLTLRAGNLRIIIN